MLLEECNEKAEREYLLKEGQIQGLEQGRIQMIENALWTTKNISQTAWLLKISAEEAKTVAKEKGIQVQDD